MKLCQIFEVETSMDFPSYVMGQHSCFLVKDRVNAVQKALRPYGGAFVLVSKDDFNETPPQSRMLFNSLQDFMNWLSQNMQTDKQRGYN